MSFAIIQEVQTELRGLQPQLLRGGARISKVFINIALHAARYSEKTR